MRKAHYLRFVEGHRGGMDRLGGLPTHLPPAFPCSPNDGTEMVFLGQFYCHPGRLNIENALCVYLYQGLEENEPCPVAVVVPKEAPANLTGLGTQRPGTPLFDIEWDERDDPDEPADEQTELAASKADGTCYFWDMIQPDEVLVLQLRQQPRRFNFGGYTAVVVRTASGEFTTRLG